jgi:hypothetical protein
MMMSDRVTFGASDSALREKAEPEDQRRLNDSRGASKMPGQAKLARGKMGWISTPGRIRRIAQGVDTDTFV